MKFIIIPISNIFNDIAETLRFGLAQLQHESTIQREILNGHIHILLGSHLITDWTIIPKSSIIYNLEQLGSNSTYLSPQYIQKLNEFQVWDYSNRNIDWLKQNSSSKNPIHVPVGYVPTLTRIKTHEIQDIDVLFYGWMNERRQTIIDQLIASGLKVQVLSNSFDLELDSYIARSKVILNVHYYESKIFEIIRVSYLLSNKKAVVSEVDDETEIDKLIRSGIFGVRYESLCDSCIELVMDDAKRKKLEEDGFIAFTSLPESDYLEVGLNLMNKIGAEELIQNELVSVVIPCFNHAQFLEECVKSIIAQSYENIEVIIVDDGSTDNTQQVIENLILENKNTIIKSIQQVNSGVSVARNQGISAASGDYILPLDGDDKIHPDMILKCMELLKANPTTSIAYTDYQHFGDIDLIVETPEYDFDILAYQKCLHTVTALYRKKCWIDTGGYNPNMIWGTEDWEFWINCGRNGHFGKRIPKPLFYYRTRFHHESRIKMANANAEPLFARIVLNNQSLYDDIRNDWAKKIWSNVLIELIQKIGSDRYSNIYLSQLTPTSLISECEILISTNNLESAITLYEHWLDHAESNLKYAIYFNLAICLENNNKLDSARNAYRKSLAENAKFAPAIINLNRLNRCNNFGESWIDLEMDFDCEVHHCFPRVGGNPNSFKVLNIATEPSVWCISSSDLRNVSNQFDLILTYRKDLLDLPNAQFMLYGGCFVSERPSIKRYEVSFLYSVGLETPMQGYLLRKEIWNTRKSLPSLLKYYSSSIRPPTDAENPWPYKSKDKLFESMFSLIIENTSEENYFTEKIIDAFQTYTIPIYWGCPNISDYFNRKGIIFFNNVTNLHDILNNLTVDFYYENLLSVIENYNNSLHYKDILKNMKANIDISFNKRTINSKI